MADTRIALLPDRGVVSVTGEDAGKLLQGVITNDMGLLELQPALFVHTPRPIRNLCRDGSLRRLRRAPLVIA